MSRTYNFNRVIEVVVTPTVTAGAYSANDVVGGLLTFAVGDHTGSNGFVGSLVLTDDGDQAAAGKVYLYNAAPATINDNDAFAPTDADNKKLIGIVTLASYDQAGADAVSVVNDINYHYTSADGNLYGYFVTSGTPTYAAVSNVTVKLIVYLT